jgi:hypothetical protein
LIICGVGAFYGTREGFTDGETNGPTPVPSSGIPPISTLSFAPAGSVWLTDTGNNNTYQRIIVKTPPGVARPLKSGYKWTGDINGDFSKGEWVKA